MMVGLAAAQRAPSRRPAETLDQTEFDILADPKPANALDIRNVEKVFGSGGNAFKALGGVSLQIRTNEFFTLLGPSGCGKTTLLRLIAGFEYPTSGHILLDGEDIIGQPPFRRPVNTVFQNYALFPHMTVAGNIGFGLEMLGKPKDEIASTVAAMLKLVRMEELKDRKTSQISGGQQQRVALARALAPRPKILLLDEPLSALDLKLRLQMQEELKGLQRSLGTTFIYVTHDQGEALAMSDRIGVMADGRLEQVGAPLEIYERPATRFVAGFIGDANLVEAVVEGIDGDGLVAARVGDARVRARRRGDERAGARLTLCVRPERVRVGRPGGRADGLVGRVEDRAFSGSLVKYRLAVSGLRLHAAVPYTHGTLLFEVGDAVSVGWDGDQAVTVPA